MCLRSSTQNQTCVSLIGPLLVYTCCCGSCPSPWPLPAWPHTWCPDSPALIFRQLESLYESVMLHQNSVETGELSWCGGGGTPTPLLKPGLQNVKPLIDAKGRQTHICEDTASASHSGCLFNWEKKASASNKASSLILSQPPVSPRICLFFLHLFYDLLPLEQYSHTLLRSRHRPWLQEQLANGGAYTSL